MSSTVQAIVYSKATGRVRRVIDTGAPVADVASFLADVQVAPGEAVMAMTKRASTPQRFAGRGNNTLHDWQAVVSMATKLCPAPMHPDVHAHVTASAAARSLALTPTQDRYCIIDAVGNIVGAVIADPSCGDSGEHFGAGFQLVAHQTADERWTYANGVFTPGTLACPKTGGSVSL